MVQHCCVRSCNNSHFRGTDSSFHLFPRDPIAQGNWLRAINLPRIALIKNKFLKVCSLHFHATDFIMGGNVKKLKRGVVPRFNLGTDQNLSFSISENESGASGSPTNNTFSDGSEPNKGEPGSKRVRLESENVEDDDKTIVNEIDETVKVEIEEETIEINGTAVTVFIAKNIEE